MNTRRTAASLAAIAALITAGCSSTSAATSSPVAAVPSGAADSSSAWTDTGKPIDVMGWSTGDEVGTSRTAYLKKVDPSLTVKPDENGFDQQKFATAMAAGSAPAGVSMDRQLLATYAAKGFLMPLDECVKSHDIDLSQYYPEAVKEASWNGHLYGIPEFYTTRGVYVNNRVLKDAGMTAADVNTADWASVRKLAGALYTESGGKPTRIGFDPKLPEYLPLWAMAAGGNIVNDKGEPTLDSPAVVKALTWAVGVIDAQGGWAAFKSFRDSWDFFGADNEFAKDQVGVMPYEQWYVNVLAGAGAKSDFTVVPFKGTDGQQLTFETGSALAIPKGSPNPGGMCQFAKDVTSMGAWMAAGAAREAVVKKSHSAFTGIFTANKAANGALREKYVVPTGNANLDKTITTFYESLDHAQMIPPSPAGGQIQEAYQQAVASALGGTDPKSALETAQQTAERAFQDATAR